LLKKVRIITKNKINKNKAFSSYLLSKDMEKITLVPYFFKIFAYLNFVVLGSYISILNFNFFSFTFQSLVVGRGDKVIGKR